MKIVVLCLEILIYLFLIASAAELKDDCTELARDEETLLVFSTLGGGLTAIDPITSEIRWTMDDEPAVKADTHSNIPLPHYLPDPRDGSIYQLSDMGDLKKLPYTIPQLVANAPCRSSDGILYSGKKSDTWFLVDPKTGKRETVMGFGSKDNNGDINSDTIGWATSRSVYLGRTQYTVMMFDSSVKNKNTKPWNITFYDYASHSMAPEISSDYQYIHLAGSSSGHIVTLSRQGGFLWQKYLKTPVVAAFLLSKDGLLSLPFTTIADNALSDIVEDAKDGNTNEIKLFQSLYVGEHSHGLYAFPSLVDKDTAIISCEPPVKLIEGPHKYNQDIKSNVAYIKDLLRAKKDVIVLGHYQIPKGDNSNKINISPTLTKNDKFFDDKQLATIRNLELIKPDFIMIDDIRTTTDNGKYKNIGIQTDDHKSVNKKNSTKTLPIVMKDNHQERIKKFIIDSRAWLTDEQSGGVHQILILLILIVITMFWYMCSTLREIRYHSQNGSQTAGSDGSKKQNSGSSNISYHDLQDIGDGEVKVGKIIFNCEQVLGKGCEGTFVFKGTFEKRQVAVKRLLPECFTFADREVALLRESDEHENVVRYFCTEQDRQFRYIAVELCSATLQDYIESEKAIQLQNQIIVWDVLKQATAGLCHLHSLNIVHRDIKPQNILLSFPDVNNRVRAMISDFGLCKKLNYGKASFSRRSGITGTEGWIAPEMIKGQRATTSVDIFSMGCVFYYILTNGYHAFGDPLKRQANILTDDYDLSKLMTKEESSLRSENILAEQLIADMIHHDAAKRPNARAVCNHPVFWNEDRILAFLQDVSDRVEKLTFTIEPLKTLEKNCQMIVREDWNLHLDTAITEDLRKYRGYMGASVRDLLRAFRNKKHHYHELSLEAQTILGYIPYEFTKYWIRKFPHLLSHSYHALSICFKENPFKLYYNQNYKFSRPDYFYANDNQFPNVMDNPKPLQKNDSPKRYNNNNLIDKVYNKNFMTGGNRKGFYNFRKNQFNNNIVENIITTSDNLTDNNNIPRNIDNGADIIGAGGDDEVGNDRKNVFANFKFRNRNSKNTNNNRSQNFHNNNNNNNKDRNITWVLPTTDNKNNE